MLVLPLLFAAQAAIAASDPSQAQLRVAAPAAVEGGLLVPQDTLIRLMVLNEVSTKTAKPGDRFVLRVDEPVVVDGVTVIPIGAKAWGEVLDAKESGPAGKAGRLSARLLSVEVGSAQVPISGENKSAGETGGNQIALGALALGPLALLARGNNAKLKAGEIFNGYIDSDWLYEPSSGTMKPAKAAAAETAK
jgi:hypothetical protein